MTCVCFARALMTLKPKAIYLSVMRTFNQATKVRRPSRRKRSIRVCAGFQVGPISTYIPRGYLNLVRKKAPLLNVRKRVFLEFVVPAFFDSCGLGSVETSSPIVPYVPSLLPPPRPRFPPGPFKTPITISAR